MTLGDIANELRDLPRDAPMEEEVRACLANLLIGIEQGHIAVASVQRRVEKWVAGFRRSQVRDFRILLLEHDTAMNFFGVEDHYRRSGPLNNHLSERAVTIQANEDGLLGRFLLAPPRRAGGAEIADAFNSGKCTGHVGRADRPVWFTPLVGEVAEIVEEAADPFCTPAKRANCARRVVAVLGLSHIQPTTELLAMVTRATIGDLHYEQPDDPPTHWPAGSTAIEARGHRRFRAWPRRDVNPFGRTFDIDDAKRAEAGHLHGVPEVVRPRLEIAAFERCVFLGTFSARTIDRRGAYLEDLGVHTNTAPDLILKLADLTGL
jgi:hypothetical protein